MIRNIRILITLSICAVFVYGFAQEFLMPEKKRSSSNLKQDILEVCGNLLQTSSKNIELRAKFQQELYEKIRQGLENDKNSLFSKYSKKELQVFLLELKKINNYEMEQNKKLLLSLNFIKNG